MRQAFLLILIGLTSAGAYPLGTKGLDLPRNGLRAAAGKTLEGLGMALVFLGINLGAGVITILVIRGLTQEFLSLYLVDDLGVAALSLFQGLTFRWWREPRASSG